MGLAVLLLGAAAVAGEARFAPAGDGLTVVVMDPLALPLSCPCVKGYAQRDMISSASTSHDGSIVR